MSLDVGDHQLLVDLAHLLEQTVAGAFVRFLHLRRDLARLRYVVSVAREEDCLLLHQVDHAVEVGLDAPWYLDRHRPRVEPLGDHVDCAPEVGACAVHLVDEADARHVVAVGLAPDRLRLRLNACNRVEHHDAAVQYAQTALHFDREVDVAGRVDDVDLVAFPLRGRRRRRDRDAALALLGHPVHHGGAFVHLTDLVGSARVIEHALGHGRLTGIDVRDDADIADVFDVRGTGHSWLPTVMDESAVRFGHTVSVLATLYGSALTG